VSKASQFRQKAQTALQKGKVQEAVEIYRKLLQVEPRNPNLHNELGDIFMRSDDRIQAIGSFEQAILNYEKVALYNNAVAVCKKILRVVPNRPETVFKIGELKAKQKFTGEAVAAFTQYFDGLLGEAAQVGEQAMKKAEKALELLPGNEEVGVRAADVLARGGHTARAAEVLAQVIVSAGVGDRTRLHRQRLESLRQSLGANDQAKIDEILASAGPAADADVSEELAHATAQTATAPPQAMQTPAPQEPEARPQTAPGPTPTAAQAPAVEHAEAQSVQSVSPEEYVIDGGADEAPAEEYVIDAGETDDAPTEYAIDGGPEQSPAEEYVIESPVEQEPPAAAAPAPARPAAQVQQPPEAAPVQPAPAQTGNQAPPSAAPSVAERPQQEQQDAAPPVPGPRKGATVSEDLSDILDAEDAAMEEAQNVASSITEEITSDVEEDDYRSHYDLGMAYIEMALYNEAIKELQISSRSEQLQLRSLEMIGHCFLLLQNPRLAVKQLTRGLDIARVSGGDSLGIHYNLGLAFEALGEVEKAREHFEEVYIVDVTFRDISDKMKKYSTVG
jgi:tetratricopeptide (TPR) repeat protein